MPFSYYRQLSARQKRTYDRSAAVTSLRVGSPERLAPHLAAIARSLGGANRAATETACRDFTRGLLTEFGVSPTVVKVLARRPSRSWGELHGLYEPAEGRGGAVITVWMRTAQRREVVAFKTFVRTLLHEIVHHLDYELLGLDDSFHTEGFYKRESTLFRQLVPDPAAYAAAPAAPRAPAARRKTPPPARPAPARAEGVPSRPGTTDAGPAPPRQGRLFDD